MPETIDGDGLGDRVVGSVVGEDDNEGGVRARGRQESTAGESLAAAGRANHGRRRVMGAVTPGRLVRRGTGGTDRGYDVGGGRLRLVIWRNYFEDGLDSRRRPEGKAIAGVLSRKT